MKFINVIQIFGLIILISCQIDEEEKTNKKPIERDLSTNNIPVITIDTDGDYITDSQEEENKTNPFIADIPRLLFRDQINTSISLKLNSKEIGGTQFVNVNLQDAINDKRVVLKDYLLFESFKQLNGELDGSSWQFDDRYLNLVSVSNLNFEDSIRKSFEIKQYIDQNYRLVQESGELLLNYLLDISKIKKVEKVESIDINLYVKNNKGMLKRVETKRASRSHGVPLIIDSDNIAEQNLNERLKLNYNNLSPQVIKDLIKKESEAYISIGNYNILMPGQKTIAFRSLVKEILKKTARIIFSTEQGIEVLYLSPKMLEENNSLLSYIEKLKGDIQIDSSEKLISIGESKTEVFGPIDLYNVPTDYLNKKVWTFIAEDKASLYKPLQLSKTYVFVFSTLGDLVNAHKGAMKIGEVKQLGGQDQSYTILKNLKVNDEITLTISNPTINTYQLKEYVENVGQWNLQRYCSQTKTVCTQSRKKCTQWDVMSIPITNFGKKEQLIHVRGDGRVCTNWVNRCIRSKQVCTAYAHRKVDINQCQITYLEYKEDRAAIPVPKTLSDEHVNRVALKIYNNRSVALNSLLLDNAAPILLRYLDGRDAKLVARIKIADDVYEELINNQLTVVVDQIPNIEVTSGYVKDTCNKQHHDNFSTERFSHTFISTPLFDTEWALSGYPRSEWK